jgi:hypothetical protein
VTCFFYQNGTEFAKIVNQISTLPKESVNQMWQGWVTGVLGIWLIIASFVTSGNAFNELGVGVAVSVIGFWVAVK